VTCLKKQTRYVITSVVVYRVMFECLSRVKSHNDYLPAKTTYRDDITSRERSCWVSSWVVYSRLDCQLVTPEHTHRLRLLC